MQPLVLPLLELPLMKQPLPLLPILPLPLPLTNQRSRVNQECLGAGSSQKAQSQFLIYLVIKI